MKSLNIGFDAKRAVRNATGLGNYSRTLLSDLGASENTHNFRMYVPDLGRDDLRSQLTMSDNMVFVTPRGNRPRLLRQMWRIKGVVKDLVTDNIDIYHGLTGELPIGLTKAGIKSVVTIHDLIFLRHPEYYKPIDVAIYRWKFHNACREATKIIAISERTKQDIIEFGKVSEERIKVVYQSCGTRFKTHTTEEQKADVRHIYDLPKRYILFVGTIEERKNALLAAKALPLLPTDIHLVLVGRQTPYSAKIIQYAASNNLTDRIHILSNVPTSHLYAIYQQAECFAYPSRYEGFGLPIVEAIQSGLPVVACTGSCLEEAGGPYNIYVNPDDHLAMAHAISQSLVNSEGREERIARSQEYVRRFENRNVAQDMLNIYASMSE